VLSGKAISGTGGSFHRNLQKVRVGFIPQGAAERKKYNPLRTLCFCGELLRKNMPTNLL
jgi:hypothetical protein